MKITESFPEPHCLAPLNSQTSATSVTRRARARIRRAMTLVEVMIAMGLFTITTLGVLGTFLQSRRSTDFQKRQIQVETLIQGILEQLKNRTAIELLQNADHASLRTAGLPAGQTCLTSMGNMITFLSEGGTPPSVAVELDTNPANNVSLLRLSPYPVLSPVNIPAGAIPADGAGSPNPGNGFGDIDGDGDEDVGVNTLFLDIKGTTGLDGSTNITGDDIRVNIMLWVRDYTAVNGPISVPSRAIFITYTWTYVDGRVSRPMIGTARAIKTPL